MAAQLARFVKHLRGAGHVQQMGVGKKQKNDGAMFQMMPFEDKYLSGPDICHATSLVILQLIQQRLFVDFEILEHHLDTVLLFKCKIQDGSKHTRLELPDDVKISQ